MGTKVDSKSYLPGLYPMRDLNEDSCSSSWPVCYGDTTITNGQYYNGFMPRIAVDGYPGYGKDALKQKMLEHEELFKNQVYELHRVYRIQRDMMEECRRKEIRGSMEPSSSSSLLGPQVPLDEARKWHMTGFPLLNSTCERTSISEVEIANSPMSCTKGNSTQPGQLDLLDSRQLKIRKKLFDLELPADEYIDTEEGHNSPELKVSHVTRYVPNGNLKSAPENWKSSSASSSRNTIWLADLNEPIDVEEATAPSTDFLGRSCINGHANGANHPTTSNAGFLGVNAQTPYYHRDGFLINLAVESEVNDRRLLSHIYEPGSSKSNLDSVTPGLQQDKSHRLQCMLNPDDDPPGIYLTQRSRDGLWRERNHLLESSDRSRDQSNNRFLGPQISSHAPVSEPFFRSSYFSGTWAHAVSSWAKPTRSFTQKITTLDSCSNSAAAMDRRGLQLSAECRESYGGKWRVGDNVRLNPAFGVDLSARNGFCHGSSSGSKELKAHSPAGGFDYLSCSRGDNLALDRKTNHGSRHFQKGSSFADSKPAIDINLNEVVSKNSSDEVDERGKSMDHLSTLPWLKNKPANANGAANPGGYLSSGQLFCKTETVGDLNEPFARERKAEITKNQNVKKILGFPIFETGDPRNEPLSSHVSTSARFSYPSDDRIGVDKKSKNIVIDINLEYEPEEQTAAEEKEKQAKSTSIRDFIDLNSCVTDYEDALTPSATKTANGKIIMEIDLESPAVPEKEDMDTPSDSLQDDAVRTAAEVILSISSSCQKTHLDDCHIDLLETSLAESFVWFVNAVFSSPTKLKMDDFEAMTLQIPETKEDYKPTPFLAEIQKAEGVGGSSLTRPRRGQSRRGRQRRDFQRDILPGLISLSRHEVTEDIQTFGGLMRATGHHWISGQVRRNGTRSGGGRGRRPAVVETAPATTPSSACTRLMQQLSNIEAGLEERSLTGWGKTPRRPRRQRCPAGNPPAVLST